MASSRISHLPGLASVGLQKFDDALYQNDENNSVVVEGRTNGFDLCDTEDVQGLKDVNQNFSAGYEELRS